MCAALARALVEGRHRRPATGPQARADCRIGRQRQPDAAHRQRAQPGLDQPVEVQRKPDRGLVALGVIDPVAAAAPDFATDARSEERKPDPALILEAVALGRVECQADMGRQGRRHRLEAGDAAGEQAGVIEGA